MPQTYHAKAYTTQPYIGSEKERRDEKTSRKGRITASEENSVREEGGSESECSYVRKINIETAHLMKEVRICLVGSFRFFSLAALWFCLVW